MWPVLEAVARSPTAPQSEATMEALFAAYGHCVSSATALVAPHLDGLISSLVACYDASGFSSCLACIGTVLEVFGAQPASAAAFSGLIAHILGTTRRRLAAGNGPGEARLMHALFDLLHRALLFCPTAVLAADELSYCFGLAASVFGALRERDALRSAATFVAQAVEHSKGALQAHQPAVAAALTANGAALFAGVFAALGDGAPSVVRGPLSEVAWVIVSTYGLADGSVACPWASSALGAAVFGKRFTADDTALVLRGMAALSDAHSKPRFRQLVSDWTKIASAEAEADILLAYGM